MLWSVIRLIFKTSSATPVFFYVFNLILSFSTCSQSFKKICTWELLDANVLKKTNSSFQPYLTDFLNKDEKARSVRNNPKFSLLYGRHCDENYYYLIKPYKMYIKSTKDNKNSTMQTVTMLMTFLQDLGTNHQTLVIHTIEVLSEPEMSYATCNTRIITRIFSS